MNTALHKCLYSLITDKPIGRWADVVRPVLAVFGFFYGLLTQLVYWCHQKNILIAYRLKEPVISIGNITLGGVGKTPLVEYVVKFYQNVGIKPAVLIRGYMGELKKETLITEESDEASLLTENLPGVPVLVGRNRLKNAQSMPEKERPDIFVLDDGFQHWSLRRDLDIVVIDSVNPFGNRHVLPRGILREPMSSMSRADLFILTKTNLGEDNVPLIRTQLKKLNLLAPIVETIHQPFDIRDLRDSASIDDMSSFAGQGVCAFCSIGDPASFIKTLKANALKVKKAFEFPDHHRYSRDDLEEIAGYCRDNKLRIVMTTQKDAVKIEPYLDLFDDNIRIICVLITIKITRGEKELHAKLSGIARK